MNKFPNIWTLKEIYEYVREGGASAETSEGWVPARPLGYPTFRSRVRIAWLVFTGKCDAVRWPGEQ